MIRPRLAWTIVVTAALAISGAGLGAQVAGAVPGLSPTPPDALQGQPGSRPPTPARPTVAPPKPAARSVELPHTGIDLRVEALVALWLVGIGAALRAPGTLKRPGA